MKWLVVFDIDGTLSDPSHRLHYILSAPKDWDAFFDAVGDDGAIDEAVAVCRAMYLNGHDIEFWTGRAERCRNATEFWLERHIGSWAIWCPLKMRADGDHRPDNVVKMEYMDPNNPPFLIFEDRRGVVDAYRARGLTVFQVAQGEF
jgi:phosphoglycolate phosphatase-like HAD superfamily hydrolase